MSSLWPGSIPSHEGVFQRIFPLGDHTLTTCPEPCYKNGSISSQWHHKTLGDRAGRTKPNHGQTMAEKR